MTANFVDQFGFNDEEFSEHDENIKLVEKVGRRWKFPGKKMVKFGCIPSEQEEFMFWMLYFRIPKKLKWHFVLFRLKVT